jgi:hypothetical protein
MAQYIDKSALVAEFNRLITELVEKGEGTMFEQGRISAFKDVKLFLDTLEVKEVDLNDYYHKFLEKEWFGNRHVRTVSEMMAFTAKYFFELGLKAQHDNWKVVDNTNHPQADKNKIYCVFTKDRHILATVINHPKDEELLQWKCTEFPHHRYDMCEGDKYMQIV